MKDLFVELQPPEGGLSRLQERLDRPRRWPVAAVVLAAAAALLLARPAPTPQLDDPAWQAMFPSNGPAVTLESPGALVPLKTEGDVLVYRVMTVPGADRR
jgi:hypothetical protein